MKINHENTLHNIKNDAKKRVKIIQINKFSQC